MQSINTIQDIRDISSVINRQFPPSQIQGLSKGGKTFAYIEGCAVIDRLNEAFTPLGWSFECSNVEKLQLGDKLHIAIYGELTVHVSVMQANKELMAVNILKGQWGSSIAKANDRGTMEFGDDLKSASTDALKKCATLFGIGNYLSRKGNSPDDPNAEDLKKKLNDIRIAKEWSGTAMKAWLSGMFHKTVTSLSDLSLDQLAAAVVTLDT